MGRIIGASNVIEKTIELKIRDIVFI